MTPALGVQSSNMNFFPDESQLSNNEASFIAGENNEN